VSHSGKELQRSLPLHPHSELRGGFRPLFRHAQSLISVFSVADPDPNFVHPGSRVKNIPDSRSVSATLMPACLVGMKCLRIFRYYGIKNCVKMKTLITFYFVSSKVFDHFSWYPIYILYAFSYSGYVPVLVILQNLKNKN
jgi:hypothetical protein